MPNAPVQALDATPLELQQMRSAGIHVSPENVAKFRTAVNRNESVNKTPMREQKPAFRGTNSVPDGTINGVFGTPKPVALSIVLPWSSLLADNRKYASNADAVWTTKEYRAAKKKAEAAIREQLPPGWTPFAEPVAFRLIFIEPNRSRRRDILNFQKLICDAMKGLIYEDDWLVDDHHWTRGIPDIDRPRAEITVRPLGAR